MSERDERKYQVEWCTKLPRDEFGDCDIDKAEYEIRIVKHLSSARRVAKQVFKLDQFGSVRINEVRWDTLTRDWDVVDGGYFEFYEGKETGVK